ncbi:MAG TPA: hypothetical protein VGF23_10100 [Gaiellaceae bacterium]
MNPQVTPVRTFGRGSPVLDYWLVHSEGFELTTPDGGNRGVVKEVVVDELGYPRALIVRGGVLQRPRVMNVSAVEAVVPADGTIRLRGNRRKRTRPQISLPQRAPGRGLTAGIEHAAAMAARLVWLAVVLALTYLVSAVGWTVRSLRTHVPVLAGRVGRASASAVAWARPHGRTVARLIGSAAVTLGLVVLALAYGVVVAIVGSGRFVAKEWTRHRSRGTSRRATPFN